MNRNAASWTAMVALVLVLGVATFPTQAAAQPPVPVLEVPQSPLLGAAPPAGAVVLFDGTDMANWTKMDGNPATWEVAEGAMVSRGGDIVSREQFKDIYLHLEWKEPEMPDARGQGRGNSGVTLQGRYEIQVLDSYGIDVPGKGDCGAVYGQYAALVNACRPPLEWQTYDVIFRAPRFDADGNLLEHARITCLQNGIVIQNNVQVTGVNYPPTDADPAPPGGLVLQDHGCLVEYRNIWIVHLPETGSDEYQGKLIETP